MRTTLDICLHLLALLFCICCAHAMLETENNEMNVSRVQCEYSFHSNCIHFSNMDKQYMSQMLGELFQVQRRM